MDAALADWIARFGPAFVFATILVSCLGAPIPALVVMLVAGAGVAAAGTSLLPYLLAAYAGAILAGITVFALGRAYGPRAIARLETRPRWGRLIARAHRNHDRWGGAAVFLGSSFAAQAGPAVNLVAGAAELSWWRFHVAHLGGRFLWVAGYLVAGYVFSDEIGRATRWATGLSWGALAVLLPVLVFINLRRCKT